VGGDGAGDCGGFDELGPGANDGGDFHDAVSFLRLEFCMVELKLFLKTGLLENTVGGVARSDFPIYGKAELRERAVPDFVISFALPLKTAPIFGKDFFDDRGVVSHFWILFL
jgi:hypothetical protein